MTGLYNRRHFVQQLTQLHQQAKDNASLLAFMMIDIDHFKNYNDQLGHLAGDEALIHVSHSLRDSVNAYTDAVFRLGGEEMAILIRVDNLNTGANLAEKVRHDIEALTIAHPGNSCHHVVTVSIGLYCFNGQQEASLNIDQLYKKADEALYQAKEQGRNRVVIS